MGVKHWSQPFLFDAPSSREESVFVNRQMKSLSLFSNFVVLPHTVFALPFALAALLLAYSRGPTANGGRSPLVLLTEIVVAVVAARVAAMAFNRIADADIDARNPRTAGRELPTGKISRTSAAAIVTCASATFLLFSSFLGRHCLMLSPFVLALLLCYSYTKRVGSYAHFVLGLALALAPGGAWWVLRPQVELTPLLLMGAVLFWVAGFDILYSCQDVVFDREHEVFSIPAKFGVETALFSAKMYHLIALGAFLLVGWSAGLGGTYIFGTLVLGMFLLGQHWLISAFDLGRINQAFFTANGAVSLFYLGLIAFCVW